MSDGLYAALELRKKEVGFVAHIVHAILTLCTGFWVLIWVAHGVSVSNHNRKIERQQEKLIQAHSR